MFHFSGAHCWHKPLYTHAIHIQYVVYKYMQTNNVSDEHVFSLLIAYVSVGLHLALQQCDKLWKPFGKMYANWFGIARCYLAGMDVTSNNYAVF